MGVAAYSEMARMLGMDDVADRYAAKAKAMATKWEQMAEKRMLWHDMYPEKIDNR